MTLGKVTLLLIQQEFGLHWTSRVVPDLDFDLEILALKTQGKNKHVNFPNHHHLYFKEAELKLSVYETPL